MAGQPLRLSAGLPFLIQAGGHPGRLNSLKKWPAPGCDAKTEGGLHCLTPIHQKFSGTWPACAKLMTFATGRDAGQRFIANNAVNRFLILTSQGTHMDSSTFTVLIAVAGLAAGFVLCWLVMRGRSAVPAPQAELETKSELAKAQARIRQLEDERQLAVKNYEDLKHETARARDVTNAVKKSSAPPAEQAAQVASLQSQLAALQAQDQATRADAAKAKSEALAEQTQARDYFRSLEKNQQLAAASAQALKLEADGLRTSLEQAQKEQASAAQQAAQVPALQARLAALQAADNQAESAEALKRAQARVRLLEQENATLQRSAAALQASAQAPKTPAAAAPGQDTQLPVLEEQVVALQHLEKAIKKEFQLLAELQRNVTLTAATRHEFSDSPESKISTASTAA